MSVDMYGVYMCVGVCRSSCTMDGEDRQKGALPVLLTPVVFD